MSLLMIKNIVERKGKFVFWLFILALNFFPSQSWAVYDVPSDRRTIWAGKTGLDPVGGIPNYTSVTCTGLDPTGATDNSAKINSCISAASPGTAVYIPAGVYLVSGQINMKSNIVLRGAGAGAPWLPSASSGTTTLNISKRISFDGGSKTTNWSPGASQGTSVTAGFTTGSTQITLSDASNYSVGNVISIFQNNDSAVVSSKGYGWLGEDDGTGERVLQQYSTITGKNGNVLTIDPPLSYASPNPPSPAVRKQTFNVVMAGLENLKINRASGSDTYIIFTRFTKNIWFKNIETYNSGKTSSGSPHIWMQFSYQNEIRDSYFHHGESYDSGCSYGVEFYHWNSSHKVENNIIRDVRHAIAFEGGGSNCAILYNYTDDNGESVQGQGTVRDTSFLGEDTMANHGAHPHMNLWEGNSSTSWWGDYTQGSSSHMTYFRNDVRCKNTTVPLSSSPWLWSCVEVEQYNYFYNIVGNVIGQSSFASGTVVDNGSGSKPAIYRFGYSSAGGGHTDSQSYSTAIKHGNYDYVTDGVAHWDGGADHTLPSSMYYNSKPPFFGSSAWPPFGSDLSPLVGTLPAKARYEGAVIIPTVKPSPPVALTIQ
jgi:hypothetical protein